MADVQIDPKEWIDPSTLIFAYTPVEGPEVCCKIRGDFLKHISVVTGQRSSSLRCNLIGPLAGK
ncbi:MAG: hypothetical protein H7251_18905 [Acetobacteraceae bacterium]|nr:hypothetical protein [Acetobacteraceae bacterium]